MIAFHAAARRKIRRTPQHQIESFLGVQHPRLAEVSLADLITHLKPVPLCRLSRQPHAVRLRLHGYQSRGRQSPCRNHSHGSQAAAKVEYCPGSRTPARAIPRGQHVVRRETMPILQLKEAEVAADGIERLARFGCRLAGLGSRRNRPRLSPALEE